MTEVVRGREVPRKTLHFMTASVPIGLWLGAPQRLMALLLVGLFGIACVLEFARRRSPVVASRFDATVGVMLRHHEVTNGIQAATVVEEYSEFAKGPSILVLQWDRLGRPLHVLWGIPKDHDGPAVIVTAYRPDPGRWSEDFMRRRKP